MLIHTISNIVEGFIIQRPSKKIKSPYVADVMVGNEEYLAHCPSLGLCGMITKGSLVFMTESSTNTKTDFKIHCVLVQEEDAKTEYSPNGSVLVGCDPILSNKIGKTLFLSKNFPYFNDYSEHKQEYKWGNSRFDHYFKINGVEILVEIKSVPTCDYRLDINFDQKNQKLRDIHKNRCYQQCTKDEYKRRATFPDGYKKSKNATVSERANKHLMELQKAASTSNTEAYLTLFIMRNDCYSFQPAWQVDPLYNNLFNTAIENGVNIKVFKFTWKFEKNSLNIYYDKELKIDIYK